MSKRVNFEIEGLTPESHPWDISISEESLKRWHDISEIDLDESKRLIRSLALGALQSQAQDSNPENGELMMDLMLNDTERFVRYTKGEEIPDLDTESSLGKLDAVVGRFFNKLIELCDKYRVRH